MVGCLPGDVQSVRLFVDGVVIPVIMVLLSLVLYFIYMLRLHAGLTFACLATMPVTWLLSVRFSRKVRPAYERNRDLVDRMVLTLSSMVADIRSNAALVSQSGLHLVGSSHALSDRSEQQAANLEQTNASVQELASTVRGNAQAAQESDRSAKEVRTIADFLKALDRMEDAKQADEQDMEELKALEIKIKSKKK